MKKIDNLISLCTEFYNCSFLFTLDIDSVNVHISPGTGNFSWNFIVDLKVKTGRQPIHIT